MANEAVERTDAIAAAWAGLQGCYSSPEAPVVYGLMVPAQTAVGQVSERLLAAAQAMDGYAEALGGGFKTRLENKVKECEEFRTEALAGVWLDATDTSKAHWWEYGAEVATVGHYDRKVHVSWKEDGGKGGMVDRNERLREDYARLVTEAFNLAAACANEISGAAGLSAEQSAALGVQRVDRISAEDLLEVWGPAAEENRNCVEQTFEFINYTEQHRLVNRGSGELSFKNIDDMFLAMTRDDPTAITDVTITMNYPDGAAPVTTTYTPRGGEPYTGSINPRPDSYELSWKEYGEDVEPRHIPNDELGWRRATRELDQRGEA